MQQSCTANSSSVGLMSLSEATSDNAIMGNNHSFLLKARGPGVMPVVKIPKLHNVNAMLALAPNDVADASNSNMTGLMAKVAAQLKRLNLCTLMDSHLTPQLALVQVIYAKYVVKA